MFFIPKLLTQGCQTTSHTVVTDCASNLNIKESSNSSLKCDTFRETREINIKKHLNKVISLSQDILEKGIKSIDVNEYFQACDDAKRIIEECRTKKSLEHDGTTSCFKCKLNQLDTRINEIVNIAHVIDLKTFAPSASSSKTSNWSSESQSDDDLPKNCIDKRQVNVIKQINKIIKIAKEYKSDGILTHEVENFLKSCEIFKSQITAAEEHNARRKSPQSIEIKQVTQTESHSSYNINEYYANVENKVFVNGCINKFKKTFAKENLKKLASHLDKTIELSKNAKKAGLISDSVDNLIKACANSKQIIKSRTQSEKPKMLGELFSNINNIMNMMNQCQKEGLVTKSMQMFLNNLMLAKAKISVFDQLKNSQIRGEGIMTYSSNDSWNVCGCNQSYCSGAVLSDTSSKISSEDQLITLKYKNSDSSSKTSVAISYVESISKM